MARTFLVLLLFLQVCLRGQQPEPGTVFRADTSLVLTDVIVLDRDRRPVRGLTAGDFTVLEDGRRRPVVAVSAIEIPGAAAGGTTAVSVERPTSGAASPLTVTNEQSATGRLAVIMTDRSIPMEGPTETARRIAHRIIDELGPQDVAAVVRSTGFGNEGQSHAFTNNRARLRGAVDAPFVGLVNPPQMTSGGLARPAYADLVKTGDCVCGLCVLDAIDKTAEALASERTRHKVIFWIGSGIVIQERINAGGMCDQLKDYRERAMRTLAASNVTFHAIDPSGLETLARTAGSTNLDRVPSPGQHLERQADLGVFPAHTGGRTVLNTNNPESAVPAIFEESSSYYLLGFTPADPGNVTRRRRIEVRVGRPGVEVRARRAIYVPRPIAPPATDLERVVDGVLATPALPMRLSLSTTIDESGSSQVEAVARVSSQAVAGTTAAQEPATFLIVVIDSRGQVVLNVRQKAALAGSGEAEVAVTFPLKPGAYEVRAGVDVPTRPAASVYGHVTVPAGPAGD